MNISENEFKKCIDAGYEKGFKGASDFYIGMFKSAGMDDCASMIVASSVFRDTLSKAKKDNLNVPKQEGE